MLELRKKTTFTIQKSTSRNGGNEKKKDSDEAKEYGERVQELNGKRTKIKKYSKDHTKKHIEDVRLDGKYINENIKKDEVKVRSVGDIKEAGMKVKNHQKG